VPSGVTDGSGDEPRESFDVHFWKIRSYKGKRGKTYTVRWTVASVTHPETFKTHALADSRLAELRTYARNGVAFDVATGLPVPEVRQARAEAAKADELSWYQHALNYVARRRRGLAGNSIRSIADTLATVTPVLLVSVYQRAWQGARLLAFTPAMVASPLAGRPYDLRHACLSTWLNAGVDPTQVAEWAGNSVEVLLRVYAKCIHGRDQINRKLIEDALRDDEEGRRAGKTSPRIRRDQP